MKYLFFVLIFVTNLEILAQTRIKGTVIGSTRKFQYFRPFKGFANNFISSTAITDEKGFFDLNFDIERPTLVRLYADGKLLILLCQPNEVYDCKIDFTKKEWLELSGADRVGQLYYNLKFNTPLGAKFTPIRDIFRLNYDSENDQLWEKLYKEVNRQTTWVDSLFNLKLISESYSKAMKVEIKLILAWEIGNMCDKYYEQNLSAIPKSSYIKKKLFESINPLDPTLETLLAASSYYHTYFSELSKKYESYDSAKVICPDVPYYSLAENHLQNFLWAHALYASHLYAPDQFDYCKLYLKYRTRFPDGVINDYFETSNICKTSKNQIYTVIQPLDKDLSSVIKFNFPKKRLFIDMWATWCAPCLMEFSNYDSQFYEFMGEKKISLVYVSIDKSELKAKWEKQVKSLNLKGYHILAGKNLQLSMKEIIFDGGTVVIPRYILIDETGKILSADFNRPSDPLFRERINDFFPNP